MENKLTITEQEHAFQVRENERYAADLLVAQQDLLFRNIEKKELADELIAINKELTFRNIENEKMAAELLLTTNAFATQNKDQEIQAANLIIANRKLLLEVEEKEKRKAELMIANIELAYQNEEKEKRAAELIIANRELAFQNEEKEKRAAELIIANKELKQIVFVVSHDLQEPLRTISNYMHLFDEDYSSMLDDNARKYLRSVSSASKRMSTRIKSLLDFALLGNNKEITLVNSGEVVKEVMADLETLIKKSNAVIEVRPLPTITAYQGEFQQLFQNLITNAIKFQRKGVHPNIRIGAKQMTNGWEFYVSDNGIGIAPHHFERIFDIFQRLHSTEEYEGSGIGLANCKKIVQLHHGYIRITSVLGEGTTFYFTIPNMNV